VYASKRPAVMAAIHKTRDHFASASASGLHQCFAQTRIAEDARVCFLHHDHCERDANQL